MIQNQDEIKTLESQHRIHSNDCEVYVETVFRHIFCTVKSVETVTHDRYNNFVILLIKRQKIYTEIQWNIVVVNAQYEPPTEWIIWLAFREFLWGHNDEADMIQWFLFIKNNWKTITKKKPMFLMKIVGKKSFKYRRWNNSMPL